MAEVNYLKFQSQYNKIYSYFRTTCEPFDFVEWDGKVVRIWIKDEVVEIYKLKDLGLGYT